MKSTKILMFFLTAVVVSHQSHQRHDKSHHISQLSQLLQLNNNFFNKLTGNIQKVVNEIFDSLQLSNAFSNEPKIQALLKMLYNLKDVSREYFEFSDVLRNATNIDLNNMPINRMRVNDLIIKVLNEKEIDISNETENMSSKKLKNLLTSQHSSSEFGNSTEFKDFIDEFITKIKKINENDLFNEKDILYLDDEQHQSGRRNLDVFVLSYKDYADIDELDAREKSVDMLRHIKSISNTLEPPSKNEKDTLNMQNRRIYGGKKTNILYYPFVVSVHILNDFTCVGSIISRDLVITAASCLQIYHNNRLFRENPKTVFVRVGSDWTIRRGDLIPVMEIYFYPHYQPRTLNHNIAIIRLQRSLYFKKHNNTKVRRILLDRRDGILPSNTNGITVLGWGAKTQNQVIDDFQKLNYAVLNIYPNDECKEMYLKDYVTDNHFCAGFITKGNGACNRDVGAPGVIDNLLVGIVSFGPTVCGTSDSPTVFTKVGHYNHWIERIMVLSSTVYGVPTTSTRSEEFLLYYHTPSAFDVPHLFPHNPFLTPVPRKSRPTTELWRLFRADETRPKVEKTGFAVELNKNKTNTSNNMLHDEINHEYRNDFRNLLNPDQEQIENIKHDYQNDFHILLKPDDPQHGEIKHNYKNDFHILLKPDNVQGTTKRLIYSTNQVSVSFQNLKGTKMPSTSGLKRIELYRSNNEVYRT